MFFEWTSFIKNYDVLLISSTQYNKVSGFINKNALFNFKRLVIDEADSIKMTGDKIRSSFTWFVTSTFGSLIYPDGINVWKDINGTISQQYSYSQGFTERCKLFGIHSRGFVKYMTKEFNSMRRSFRRPFVVKNCDTFIQNAFNLELPNEEILYCKMPISLSVLSTSASAEIVAFINAGDIQGAVESLNCDKVTESG